MKAKTKNHSCFLGCVISLALIFGGAFSVGQHSSLKAKPLSPKQALPIASEGYSTADFETADNAPADFSIDIKSATSTSRSKRIKATFASSSKEGIRDSTGLFYVVIDDARYSGNSSDPVANPEDFPEGTDIIFNGYTINIDPEGSVDADSIYIPEFVRRGSSWKIQNTSIETHTGTEYASVKSIYIPAGITNVSFEAFINVPSDLTFYVEHESKPEGWEEGWNDGGQVQWGYTGIPDNKKSVARNASVRYFGDVSDYLLGYVDNEDPKYVKPLVVSYEVTTATGEKVTKWEELPIESTVNKFDGIGSNIGKNSIDKNIELDFEEGDVLDYHSITFYNIYPIVSENDKRPDLEKPYYSVARKKFSEESHIDNYINYKFDATADVLGYTAVTMRVDKVTPSPYLVEMEAVYNEKLEFIESGRYVLRYAFYNLTACSYEITYESAGEIVTKIIPLKTPETAFALGKDKNNQVTFLIKNSDVAPDFDVSKLKEFGVTGLTLNIHLYDKTNNNKVGRTELIKTFGLFEVMPPSAKKNLFSINVLYAVVFPAYYVAFALATLGLYFLLKEKNKNDEFRRMKTKPFIIKAIVNGVCSSIVLLAALSIILRLTVANNTVTTFNPLDIFIVFAGIVSVVIIGFFIRNVYVAIKNIIHRRQIMRLKLNQDQDDDGTN